MLKIVKGYGYGFAPNYSIGEPVKIDNTVYVPGEDEETGEFISAEEQRRRAEEEKAAEEKRFRESVDAEVSRIMAERGAALEQERTQVIEKAKGEAAGITAEAKVSSMALMDKTKKECVMLKEQAKKEGYNDGFGEGRNQSLDKYKKCIDAAGKLLSEINARKEAYYISNEEEMRETVFALVNKVVRTELKTNPKVIESIMAEAAKNFRNSDYLKITLAEDSITERFRTDEKLLKDIIPFIPEIELELDSDAEEGTVIEDDGSQIVDAGVPTQLEFLKEVLKNSRGDGDEVTEGLTVESEGAKRLSDIAAGAADTVEAADEMGVPEEAVSPNAEEILTDEDVTDVTQLPEFKDIMNQALAEMGAAETDGTETGSKGRDGMEIGSGENGGGEKASPKKKPKSRPQAAEEKTE